MSNCRLNVTTVLSILLVANLLGGCALVRAFIPDQDLGDAFGVDGQEVALVVQSPTSSPATANTDTGLSAQVSEIPEDKRPPSGLEPRRISETFGFERDASLGAALADFPAELNVTRVNLAVSVVDGDGDLRLDEAFTEEVSLTLERGACSPTACDYAFTDADAAKNALPVAFEGQSMRRLYDILTSGSDTNEVNAQFNVVAQSIPTLPAESVLTLVLEANGGVLSF